jgi:antitoxin ParD1/3/4
MATMNVFLPDPMKTWVEARTQDGRFSNASDDVRDLIRRHQDRPQAITELQQLVDDGTASGPARHLDLEAFLARKRDQTAKTDGR